MKDYVTPEMEITEFEMEDVITTSGGSKDPASTPLVWDDTNTIKNF